MLGLIVKGTLYAGELYKMIGHLHRGASQGGGVKVDDARTKKMRHSMINIRNTAVTIDFVGQ